MDFPYIENYINNFVETKLAEKIQLGIHESQVDICPVSRRGSLLLAMFWVKVLQHADNFPTSQYTYHKLKDTTKNGGAEKLFIQVEDIMITVNLTTGSVEVMGENAVGWFGTRFTQLLSAYSGYRGDTKKWYEEEEFRMKDRRREERLRLGGGVKLLLPGPEMVTPLEEEHLMGLWLDEVLSTYLENIRSVCIRKSRSFIYRLWKSVLNRWLSNERISVYIVSAQLDSARLRDISDICLLNKDTCKLACLYAPFACLNSQTKTLSDVRHEANKGYSPDEQLWVQYKVFDWITSPRSPIGCNFVAGVCPDLGAELLVTSARFCGDDLDREALNSVQYVTMSESMFMHEFLQPIQGFVEKS